MKSASFLIVAVLTLAAIPAWAQVSKVKCSVNNMGPPPPCPPMAPVDACKTPGTSEVKVIALANSSYRDGILEADQDFSYNTIQGDVVNIHVSATYETLNPAVSTIWMDLEAGSSHVKSRTGANGRDASVFMDMSIPNSSWGPAYNHVEVNCQFE